MWVTIPLRDVICIKGFLPYIIIYDIYIYIYIYIYIEYIDIWPINMWYITIIYVYFIIYILYTIYMFMNKDMILHVLE